MGGVHSLPTEQTSRQWLVTEDQQPMSGHVRTVSKSGVCGKRWFSGYCSALEAGTRKLGMVPERHRQDESDDTGHPNV